MYILELCSNDEWRQREAGGGSLFLSFVASSRAYPKGLPKRRHLCISSAKLIDLFRTSTVHSIWTDRTVALFFQVVTPKGNPRLSHSNSITMIFIYDLCIQKHTNSLGSALGRIHLPLFKTITEP